MIYSSSASGASTVKSAEADCPSGKKPTGGGHIIVGDKTNARVTVGTVNQVPNPSGWYVEAVEPTTTGEDWTLYAYVVCVDVVQ